MAEQYALLPTGEDDGDGCEASASADAASPAARRRWTLWRQRSAGGPAVAAVSKRVWLPTAGATCGVGLILICAAALIGCLSTRGTSNDASNSSLPSAEGGNHAYEVSSASYSPNSAQPLSCRVGVLQPMNCHPEAGVSEASCVQRNCTWCADALLGVHRCILSLDAARKVGNSNDDDGCPTKLPRHQRVDCHPDDGCNEASCLSRGCNWCPTNDTGIPSCFYDATVTLLDIADEQPITCAESAAVDRVDCLPQYVGAESPAHRCQNLGCRWCPSNVQGLPWCFYNTENWSKGKEPSQRVNCLPEGGGSGVDTCMQRGCLLGRTIDKAPACYFPDDYGYQVLHQEDIGTTNGVNSGIRVHLRKAGAATIFGGTMKQVAVTFEYQTNHRLRVKFVNDSDTDTRFEVPLKIPVEKDSSETSSDRMYDVEISQDPVFSFKVIRRSTGSSIFDSSLGGLTLEDQFIQIAARLPSSDIYGLGESEHHSFKHSMNWQTWGMYARDQPPVFRANSYGVHPFYTVLEKNGSSHGVLFLNSAAQDFTLTPAPGLIYRTIGGILDMYFFFGPTPEKVVQQYTLAIGRTFMPAYWSLGFQLCRYGYNNISAMQAAVDRMRQYDLPHDVQYGDIDTMWDNHDFTYDPTRFSGFPEYIEKLKKEGTRYVTILDPCIDSVRLVGAAYHEAMTPLLEGNRADVWLKMSDGTTNVKGKVWPPNDVYFPDFTLPATKTWWIEQAVKFREVIKFDGLWIDMNEPSNFVSGSAKGCSRNNINYPPFVPAIFNRTLHYKTLCPDFRHHLGAHYDVHNLYGWSETEPTQGAVHAATGRRGMVLSRSTYPGSGKYGGHWLGDNFSIWSNLYYSIIGMLEFNLFGIPFVGADICGFNGNTTYELCLRWMQLGAFYPFSRNHNDIGQMEQDPGVFGPEAVASSRAALMVRYTLLPYLYTLFYHAHVSGSTVARALFHEFPTENFASSIDRQFLWGPAFMVSPVLDKGATFVSAYFPRSRWFSYYTGEEVALSPDSVRNITLAAPLHFIPLHVRGGYILPTQQPANCTMLSRTRPLGLLAVLDELGAASGDLFWDDGETIGSVEAGNYSYFHFYANTSDSGTAQLIIESVRSSGPPIPQLQQITVYGLKNEFRSVTIDNMLHGNVSYNKTTMAMFISGANVNMPSVNQKVIIRLSASQP